VLIRTRVKEIREMGRATQGVTLINLDKGEKLSGIERVLETETEGDTEEVRKSNFLGTDCADFHGYKS